MPRVLPSHIVDAIDHMFGPSRQEIYSPDIDARRQAEVHTLLTLLDQVPSDLIDLPSREYLELNRCRGALSTALAHWGIGQNPAANAVQGKDPVERIRRLMTECRDELPPPEPELPFIQDQDIRSRIEERIRAAWTDFNVNEWIGATVFCGSALEAVLLWAITQKAGDAIEMRKRAPEELPLRELIDEAADRGLISEEIKRLAHQARDSRNLMHAGKAIRENADCTKGTSLTGLAALYRTIEELKRSFG